VRRLRREREKAPTAAKAQRMRGNYLRLSRVAANAFMKDYNEKNPYKLRFDMDDVHFLDRMLEANYEECKLTQDQITKMGSYYAELMRRNIGGTYQYVQEKKTISLRCEGIVAFPVLRILKALREKKRAALEAYLFTFARLVSERRAKGRQS
jgi:hypothetical protein